MRIFSSFFWRLAWLAILLWLGLGLTFWALAWCDASQLEEEFLQRRHQSVVAFLSVAAPDLENPRLLTRAAENLFRFDSQIASVKIEEAGGTELLSEENKEVPTTYELLSIYGSQASVLAPLHRFLAVSGYEQTGVAVDQATGAKAQYQVYGEQLDFLLADRLFTFLLEYGVASLFILVYFLLIVRLAWPLRQLQRGALAIAGGDLSAEIPVQRADELGTIITFFNEVARNLKQVAGDLAYKDRVAHELQMATQIQQKLLPKNMPQTPGLVVAARTVPAVEIGGDAYDFVINERGDLFMYLGDVTGHGVPAALVMTMMNILLRAYHQVAPNLAELFSRVNGTIFPRIERNMFMTAAGLLWHAKEQKLTYVNAGHEPLLHYKRAEQQCVSVNAKGIALGMLPDNKAQLQEVSIDLHPGDLLAVYSDGLIEATNNYDEAYGSGRLQQALVRYGHREDLSQVIAGVLEDLHGFTGKKQDWADDVTMLLVRKV